MLIVPLSLSHYSLEGEDRGQDEKVGKYYGDGLLECGADEVRVSRVGGWGKGELASKNCIYKGMCITGLLDQQKCKPK